MRTRKASSSCLLGLFLVTGAGTTASHAEERHAAGEIDHLALASVLLRDGHLDRAASVLSEVDSKAEGLDLARYYTLSGVVALKRQDHRRGVQQLEAALVAGNAAPEVLLLLAQGRFALQDWHGALRALRRLGGEGRRWARAFALRAQCHWRLGERTRAWAALESGLRHHPTDLELARNKVMLLVDLGLYRQAARAGRRLLARARAKADDYVAIAEALGRAGQHGQAVLLLEEARLRFPRDGRLLAQLARAYLKHEQPLAAAGLLHRASHIESRYRAEAAELYRRAGRTLQALRLNEQVDEQKTKTRQRMGLLLELGRFEAAAALGPRLSRLGLLEQQKLRYALAYTYFKTGQFGAAERWLQRIDEPELYSKAVKLRQAIASCEQIGWMCN